MTDSTVQRARELLRSLQESLRGDGYDIDVDVDAADPGIKVIVSAGDSACAECLVPPSLFESVVSSTLLRGNLAVDNIEVVYPTVLPH